MSRKTVPKVTAIRVLIEDDTDVDVSWIGEYSNTPREGAIDVWERKKITGGGYYRYFNPATPEYAEQDFEHMEAINDGRLSFVYIRVTAVVSLKHESGMPFEAEIDSDGLSGVETGYGEVYRSNLREELINQLYTLRGQLREYGLPFPKKMGIAAIDDAMNAL